MRGAPRLAWLVAAAALAAAGGARGDPPVTAPSAPEIRIAEDPAHGEHLVDQVGRPLYRFAADEPARGDRAARSQCSGDCLSRWPPLVAGGEPLAGERIDAARLGTLLRESGVRQVTWDGWPLYYYAPDEAGEIRGDGVVDAGGRWQLARPD